MSKIEWTQETWNPLIGCSKISPGCKNCYAIQTAWIRMHNPKMAERYAGVVEKTPSGALNWTGKVNVVREAMEKPLRKKTPTMYFVNSMSDLFHEAVPFEVIDQVFAVMGRCQHHTFQVLTKRPARMLEYYKSDPYQRILNAAYSLNLPKWLSLGTGIDNPNFQGNWGWKHVWLGVSVENQQTANERIPLLLQVPAAVRFLSCEPLLGPVDLTSYLKPHNNEIQKQRIDNLSGCTERGIDDRRIGQGLEEKQKGDFNSCGTRSGGIFSDQENVQLKTDGSFGSQASIPPLQRENTGWLNSEPQEREQKRQQPDQSRTDYIFGERNSRTQDFEERANESVWGKECNGQADQSASYSDSPITDGGEEIKGDRAGVQNNISGSFKNSEQHTMGIHWLICGGESGHGARPMHPDWVRSLRDQCAKTGTAFFFKQWGEYYTKTVLLGSGKPTFRMFDSMQHWVNKAETWVRGAQCVSIDGRECKSGKDFQECAYPVAIMDKVGKKIAGRMLDGREWNEFPGKKSAIDEDPDLAISGFDY